MPRGQPATDDIPGNAANRRLLSSCGWLAGGDGPRTRLHVYLAVLQMMRQLRTQRVFDFLPALLRLYARFAKNLARRPQCELEIHCLLDGRADHHRPVGPLDPCILESCRLELRGDNLRVGHGERSRPAGLRVLPRRWQIPQHDLLRDRHPGVVGERAFFYNHTSTAEIYTVSLLADLRGGRAV